MQIICISKEVFSTGDELAKRLAKKLGYECVSRDALVEDAIKVGISVGKLEMSMIKPNLLNEKLILEKEHYRAFMTSALCEKVLINNIVYHGRTGHLLLPGVAHVLRVRIIADKEYRINQAMQKLNLSWAKAKEYIENVDEDTHKWVKFFYGEDWGSAVHYDIVINLQYMNIDNASSALCTLAQLPDFQATPSSVKAMKNILLSAQARLLLAKDKRTYDANVKITADNDIPSLTYLPRQVQAAEAIPEILKSVKDCKKVIVTPANTNILWIQEKYELSSEPAKRLLEVAEKWNSAIELLRLLPEGEEPAVIPVAKSDIPISKEYNGGIEDDIQEVEIKNDDGVSDTIKELTKIGRSGGFHQVKNSFQDLLSSIDKTVNYSLIVVGDIFLAKGYSARLRAARELKNFLSEKIKAPVVNMDELKSQFLFGPKQLVRLLVFSVCVILLYTLVFTNQELVLSLLKGGTLQDKILRAGGVFIFSPVVAYLYGNTVSLILKLLKFE